MTFSALSTRGTNFLVEFHRHVVNNGKRKLTDTAYLGRGLLLFVGGYIAMQVSEI